MESNVFVEVSREEMIRLISDMMAYHAMKVAAYTRAQNDAQTALAQLPRRFSASNSMRYSTGDFRWAIRDHEIKALKLRFWLDHLPDGPTQLAYKDWDLLLASLAYKDWDLLLASPDEPVEEEV